MLRMYISVIVKNIFIQFLSQKTRKQKEKKITETHVDYISNEHGTCVPMREREG